MARVYPERVTASMVRVIHDEEVLLLRHSTEIHFGKSDEPLGTVVMTNPGKFEFNKTPGWNEFKNGKGSSDVFEAADYPDLSMQNVIGVIRAGYDSCGLAKPNGIVRVYNLSNVRQPDGQKAEFYHKRARMALDVERIPLLEDPIVYNCDNFIRESRDAKFIIMGFVNGVFDQQMRQVSGWAEEFPGLVVAHDNKGNYSHPRRWRTEPQLKQQAIESMTAALRR